MRVHTTNIPRASAAFSLARFILPVALLLLCAPTFSQSPHAPGGQGMPLQERQQRLLEEQQRRLEELKRLPEAPGAPAPAQPAQPGACINIGRIQLEGAGQLPEAEQRETVAPFEGQCLDSGKLNGLLGAITQAYLGRGLITSRAYLPPQDPTDGTLTVKVIEGRLEGIFPSGEGCPQGGVVRRCGKPSQREIWMSFPGKTGKVLNVRELEQMLDQLGRLPSRASTLDLLPGTEPGMSKVEVKNEPQKSWRIGARFDNTGFKSTGEEQIGTYLVWDSPLGLADQLSLSAGRDSKMRRSLRSENQGLSYSLPFGWWSFAYSASASNYKSQTEFPGIPGIHFKNSGNSQQHRLRAERLLYRDSVGKSGVALGVAHMKANNYFEDVRLETSSYRLSELELSFNHGRRIKNAFVNAEIGYQHGIGEFGAQRRGEVQGSMPDARYKKYTLTLSGLVPFSIGAGHFSFESVAFGQKSESALYSPQRVGLGGLASVRGFKDQIQYGNSGGYWRNQVRWRKPVGFSPTLESFSLALAYDMGAIQRNKRQGDESAQLTGAGVELAAQGKYLSASLTYAHTLSRPKGWKRERPVYFSLNLTY